jgi:hypothetical protein
MNTIVLPEAGGGVKVPVRTSLPALIAESDARPKRPEPTTRGTITPSAADVARSLRAPD